MLVFGNGFKLTTKGKQMVSSGASYSFSKIVLGAGTYTSAEDATTRTALKAQKQSFDVSDTAIDGSIVTIAGVITNASLAVGYTITEAGVIAKDSTGAEHLFLIGVATLSDPMPAHSDNIPDVICDMKIKYTTSNTSKVSLSVPETAYARAVDLKAVNSQLAQIDNQKATKEEIKRERARIDNLIVNSGATEGNAELIDARISADGINNKTVGNYIRGIELRLGQDGTLKDITGNVSSGYYVATTDGSIVASDDYQYTEFIPVEKGDVIYITACVGGAIKDNNFSGIAGYDKNKQFSIALFNQYIAIGQNGSRSQHVDYPIIIPEGVSYIRGCSAYKGTYGMEIELSITKYAQISGLFETIGMARMEQDITGVKTNGKYISTYTGEAISSSDYEISTFIPVTVGDVILVTCVLGGVVANNNLNGIVGYDSSYNYVQPLLNREIGGNGDDRGEKGRTLYKDYRLVIPNGVEFLRGCSAYQNSSTFPYPSSELIIKKVINGRGILGEIYDNNIKLNTIENRLDAMEYVAPNDIIKRNLDCEDGLVAISGYNSYNSTYNPNAQGYKKDFTVSAITDLHGSTKSIENFIDYINNYSKFIDIGICLGDTVQKYPTDDISFYSNAISRSNIPVLYTIGNHDVADAGGSGISISTAYSKFIEPLINRNWIEINSLGEQSNCYYYKDFSAYKIRVISLFEYEATQETTNSESYYYRRYMTSKQLQWFADTLFRTPSEYSVIVIHHQLPFTDPVIVDGSFTESEIFRQVNNDFKSGFGYLLVAQTENLIGDIINAFKTSSAINKTYSASNYGDKLSPVTISKDFSSREIGKFICTLVGHTHAPFITRNGGYNNQITIAIPSGSLNHYQRKADDIKPTENTRNEDNFYCIGFDTDKKLIKILKIGGQKTIGGTERVMTAIKYD